METLYALSKLWIVIYCGGLIVLLVAVITDAIEQIQCEKEYDED